MDISVAIKEIRMKSLLSQNDFANAVGVSFSTVNRWEKGHAAPNYKALKKIREFCHTNHIDFDVDRHIDEVLKPCPFCGSEKVEVLNRLEWEPEMEVVGLTKDNWNVLCNECYAIGGTRRTAFEAIDAWNMRAGT